MEIEAPVVDPDENDPARWGHSLANLGELLIGCLDARAASSVAEVGAYAGDLTRLLLGWADRRGARVIAIEPEPQPGLVELSARPDLDLIRSASHDALRDLELPDAIVIDSDHNYYTVSEELRIIAERATQTDVPLLLFHDVGWPHGRRDAYWSAARVPEEHRQPLATNPCLFPGDPGVVDEGLRLYTTAAHEGGSQNGVLTAIEDFVDGRPELRLAVVPAFFGFGVVWRRDASWSEAVERVVEPWDGNPILDRLEANRVFHLATSAGRSIQVDRAAAALEEQRAENTRLEAQLERLRTRSRSQERVLRALLDSGGLRLADRLSALRHQRRDWSWPGRIRAALGERIPR